MKPEVRRRRYVLIVLSVSALILWVTWFFMLGPVRLYSIKSPDQAYELSVYWAGIPKANFFYLQGSDRDYYPGYVVLWKKGSLLPLQATALPNLLFDSMKWTSNTVLIQRPRPEPVIVWTLE